jgi:CSLREA domain-containing protein
MKNQPHPHRLSRRFLLPLLGLAACGQEQPTAPDAAPAITAIALRVVNSGADPGDGTCNTAQCTLREALKDPATTAIQFAPGLTGTITLAPPAAGGGTLRIDRSLTITGPSGRIIIQRRSTDPAFRILRVAPGATVALTNLTLRGGLADKPGGGIINYGTLQLTNVRVVANASNQHGGGIDSHGPLTLTNSDVTNNKAPSGGGIDSHDDMTVTLTNCNVSRNQGGGIRDDSRRLVIRHSAIMSNAGTGIATSRADTVVFDHVKVVGNTGTGVSLWYTHTSVDHSTIARNGRGFSVGRGRLTIANSTIAGNSPGGGIHASSVPRGGVQVRLTNSTVTGNSAEEGGGIYIEDDTYASSRLYLVNTTVAYNTATYSGGGVAQRGEEDAWLDVWNSIVARNTAPVGPDVGLGGEYSQVSVTYSLIGDGSGTGIPNEGANLVGNVPPYTAPIDPLLGSLSKNGGPTATHALLEGSPAIDAGTAEGCPAADQRGVPRPQGDACDMGSFERQ